MKALRGPAMNILRRPTWPALAAAALCAACAGSDFQWSQARQIKAGMTADEVSALMGPPTARREQPFGETWTWAYMNPREGSARAVSVGLHDGRVIFGPGVARSFE